MHTHQFARFRFAKCLFALALCSATFAFAADEVDFNREIRPILTNACFRCHGPDGEARESGLQLDDRKSAITKLESGNTAIVPGKSAQSELFRRITSEDESERMPPADAGKKLSKKEADLLKKWIDQGAKYAQHWSFVKPSKTPLPQVSNSKWPRNNLDRYVLARLDNAGMKPSPEADRYALIRRLSLDLTGLPPTLEQVDEFIADERPDAYEKLVDRLLASPTYGERWARVWLDLARYADSQGYAQDSPRTIWRFRDWTIKALNENKPFDQFTIEQIAGDLLPNPSEEQLIATAFHRNTMTNSEGGTDDEEFRSAAIVDRVNTTMLVWMGLTMGCAQCHTHKYDPITQEEYYRFYAILNNTEDSDKPNETPTLSELSEEKKRRQKQFREQIAALEKKIEQTTESSDIKPPPKKGPLLARFVRIELPGKQRILSLAEVQVFSGDKNIATDGTAKQSSVAYDGPAKLANDGNTDGHFSNAKSTTHTSTEDDPWWEVDLGEGKAISRVVIWNRTDSESIGGRLDGSRIVFLDEKRGPLWVRTIAKAAKKNGEHKPPQLAEKLNKKDREELTQYYRQNSPELRKLGKQLDKLQKDLAAIKPVITPIMRELPENKHRKTHIHIRGNFLSKGKEVTPGVPAAFHQLPAGAKPNRLNLARWLVSKENPLTARVVVNRYWEHLFGIGLLETSEDFGLQGELPSHPKLLDHLAIGLMESDWDVKQLLRTIVTSATYRQSSATTPELLSQDPFNRLLGRGPRFRLSAEMIRDQALAVGGLLSNKMYGPSVRPPRPVLGLRAAFGGSTDWKTSPGDDKFRRGLYTSWRRTTPYPSMATFDAPSREVCTVRRIRTNTPLQALVTLNDPVFVEAAQALARRMATKKSGGLREQLHFGFRLCVSRPPKDRELDRLEMLYTKALERFADDEESAKAMATDPIGPLPKDASAPELAALTVVGNVLLNLDEVLAKR